MQNPIQHADNPHHFASKLPPISWRAETIRADEDEKAGLPHSTRTVRIRDERRWIVDVLRAGSISFKAIAQGQGQCCSLNGGFRISRIPGNIPRIQCAAHGAEPGYFCQFVNFKSLRHSPVAL